MSYVKVTHRINSKDKTRNLISPSFLQASVSSGCEFFFSDENTHFHGFETKAGYIQSMSVQCLELTYFLKDFEDDGSR